MSEFESWLGAQLKALETDDEVYLPYIVSILEDEDDKSGAIDDLLSGISDKEAENKALRIQILERWDRLQGGVGEGEPEVDGAAALPPSSAMEKLDLSAQLASITESRGAAYAAQKAARDARSTQPDKAVKEAILAQYSGAVEESSGDESADGDHGEGELDEMRNANAEAVESANAEKREKARAAAAAKKDKDKEDREKQKKQAEDRKKKAQEKAAKGERRR